MPKRYQFFLMAVLVTVLAAPVWAGVTNPVIDFGISYAKEGNRTVDVNLSQAGDTLTIVGPVVQFQEPFQDLDAHDPSVEYTYVMDGLVSLGTTVEGGGTLFSYTTHYDGGAFRIYCDDTPDADFGDMSTFQDGTLILEGTFSGFHTVTYSFSCSGTQNSDLQFTGGSLFDRVSDGGVGYTGTNTGSFNLCADFVDDAREAEGYFALSDTKIDVVPPTPVESSTWSRIKYLYE